MIKIYDKLMLYITICISIILFVIAYYHPSCFQEDKLVENVQAITLLSCCITCIFKGFKIKYNTKKKWYFFFSFIFFFILCEEISYGQRLFNLNTPKVLQLINYQKEISFHNINGLNIIIYMLKIISLMFISIVNLSRNNFIKSMYLAKKIELSKTKSIILLLIVLTDFIHGIIIDYFLKLEIPCLYEFTETILYLFFLQLSIINPRNWSYD